MGKYTSLIHKVEETEPQGRGGVGRPDINNVNIDNIHNNIDIAIDTPTTARPKYTLQGSSPVEMSQDVASGGKGKAERPKNHDTPLRPYAVNAVIRCIHGMASDECAVCIGYVDWLIADEDRLRRARANPEAARREFWRTRKGETA